MVEKSIKEAGGDREKAALIPQLAVMRDRITKMAEQYDTRLAQVRQRNVAALDSLQKLSEEFTTRHEGYGRVDELDPAETSLVSDSTVSTMSTSVSTHAGSSCTDASGCSSRESSCSPPPRKRGSSPCKRARQARDPEEAYLPQIDVEVADAKTVEADDRSLCSLPLRRSASAPLLVLDDASDCATEWGEEIPGADLTVLDTPSPPWPMYEPVAFGSLLRRNTDVWA